MWKKICSAFSVMVLGVFVYGASITHAAPLTLFTPYTGLSVTPGESISYSVNVINDSNEIQNITFSLEDLPEDWDYSIRSGGNSIQQLSVRDNSEEDLTVEVNVPLEIDKGTYRFELVASGNDGETASLPFLVEVSEQGTFKTEFTSEQPNME